MIATIAVGIDGTDTSQKAADAALELAERFGAKLVFISAYSGSGRRTDGLPADAPLEAQWATNPAEQVEDLLRAAVGRAAARGVDAASTCSEGDAGEVLVNLAERNDADVLVIGNRGMQRRVLGSVPNTVTHKAKCSVFVVKTT
jgi:nucleotide-binding universal stress UspA family protein